MNIDSIMKELAEYIRMGEQIAATVTGAEHKATYKAVTSSRIDTTALKRELPGVAAQYTKATETRRFTFS
jgi:predicted phage-related endonuclease